MKTCTQCQQAKPTTEYRKNCKSPDGLQYACKECARQRDRDDYQKAGRKESIVARRNRVYAEQRQFLWDYLETHPCVDCGEADRIVLQFDHVRGVKINDVGNMVGRVADRTLVDEIEKCEVRCANCHTRKTAIQFGWLKANA
jgi:hypothetical protein